MDDIYNSLDEITRNFDELVAVEDAIRFPAPSGYRDIKLIFRDKDGLLSEVQLLPREMYQAKIIETPLYNIVREFANPSIPPSLKNILEAKATLRRESPAIYADAEGPIDDIIRYAEGDRNVAFEEAKENIKELGEALYDSAWEKQLTFIQ